jgi:hypothetical protein
MITFIGCTWLASDDLYLRVEIGLVASSIVALLVFTQSLRQLLNDGATISADSLSDALSDRPFEA